MIGTAFLLKDLKRELQKSVSDLWMRAPVSSGQAKTVGGDEKHRIPGVYYGGLPIRKAPKPVAVRESRHPKSDDDDEFADVVPFVLIKLLDQDYTGEKTREGTANIGIVYTIFAPDDSPESGMDDLLNVSDRIILALCLKPFWGDDHWRHEMPIHMVQGTGRAENVYFSGLQGKGPYYGGAVMTQFKAAIPGQIMPPGIIDTTEPEYPAYFGGKSHG